MTTPRRSSTRTRSRHWRRWCLRRRTFFASRNKFLDLYNSQDLISIKDYYDAKQTILDDAVKGEQAAIDKEIALATARKNAPTTSAKDRAEAEGQIEALVRRRADVEKKAGESGIELSIERKKTEDDFQKTLLGVNAQVLDLGENFAAAAAIKFDLQNDALKKIFTKEGNQAGLDALATLRANTIAQAAFQKASLDSGRILDSLSNTEDRIALAQESGLVGTLDGLVKVGQARRAQIPLLEAEVQAKEAIAKASDDPGLTKNAEDARLALDKLKASADPLAESLNKTFGADFESALDDFVTGTKTASQAFSSFAKSVLDDILKMGSKSIAEELFGGSGGVGGWLSHLGSGAGATTTSKDSDSLIGSIANFFKSVAGYAQGTNYVPETGLALLHKGEAVVPKEYNPAAGIPTMGAGAAARGNVTHTYNLTVNPPAGATRATSEQIGADVLRWLKKVERRGH